jgi:hypothetical protein
LTESDSPEALDEGKVVVDDDGASVGVVTAVLGVVIGILGPPASFCGVMAS